MAALRDKRAAVRALFLSPLLSMTLWAGCGPTSYVVMQKPKASPPELAPLEAEAKASFVQSHPGFKVFSVSFDPPSFAMSENKAIGAIYRGLEAWVGARDTKGCNVFKASFRSTQAPDKTWTKLDWFSDGDMAVVQCGSPWGDGPAPE